MKVLIITQKVDEHDSILGFFCSWLNELANKIDKIYVLALEKKNTDLAKNIELYSLGKENGSNRLRRFVKFNYCLAKIIFNKRVDIIFVHMCPEYALLVSPYAKMVGVPVIMWYAHGNVDMRLRIAHFLVNKVVSSSNDGFRINSKKLTIIGQGIDVEKFKPQATSLKPQNVKKTILSVGRISPIKNYETLIKVADILVNQKNSKDLKFQIIGGIPLKSQKRYFDFLKDIVRRYNLEDYIRFIGPIPYTQIHNYYQNCDLFVSTSNAGSLEKTPLEAMASTRIVLTSNEAFKDVLNSYSNRLMFGKDNAVELAEKIEYLLRTDEKTENRLGLYLRNIVEEKHSLSGLIDKLTNILQNLVEDNKRG